MTAQATSARAQPDRMPPLRELGEDLLRVSRLRRAVMLASPFAWAAAYAVTAAAGYWWLAVPCVMALTFVTYGSVSHDLVHGNLGLSQRTNRAFLSAIELLTLRSGHAYRRAHLHHHAHFPHETDVEAKAAGVTFVAALLEGPVFVPRVWLWALRRGGSDRVWILTEGGACMALTAAAVAALPLTPVPLVYAVLVVMGSWTFPLITAYLPHDSAGANPLRQTRAFRGIVAAAISFQHLYHLEHHLYPAVPHHHWRRLARRLDPYLHAAGVRPIRVWF